MIRAALALFLSLACLAAGLLAVWIQSYNHARADDLARLQREWEMRRSALEVAEAQVAAHVWGVAATEELLARRRGSTARAVRAAPGAAP